MVCRRRRVLIALLLLAVVVGCGEEEQTDTGTSRYRFLVAGGEAADLAREARTEGDEFLEREQLEAARESHLRAYQYAEEALAAQDDPEGRAELLDFLAHLAVDIGKLYRASDYLGRAVRHANERLREDSGLFWPLVFKAAAYAAAGMLLPAQQIFEALLSRNLDPEQIVRKNLTIVYYEMAKRLLIEDAVGARALARRALAKAMETRPEGEGEYVDKLWQQLMQHYAEEANAVKDDPLALARIHCRYGLSDPLGAEYLAKAVKENGRTMDVRWVEARYVEEMDGRPEVLESAAEHYLQLMSRGDRAPVAAAGLGRVLHDLGRHEEALSKLEGFPEPVAELQRVLVLLRLARIEDIGEEESDREKEEFGKVEDLLSGEMASAIRARLLTRVGLTALFRGNPERLAWATKELRRRLPDDPRVYVLDAELSELKVSKGKE